MKNTISKIKSIKIKKQPRTTYCFGCKDYTHNFGPEKMKMTNKVLRKISLHCLLIKYVKIFKTKNKLTTDVIKIK